MKAVGAGVVSGPAVQMNEIISRGVVDAFVGVGATPVRDFRLIPYTKSRTRFSRGINTVSFSLLMNEKKWNALSKEDQEAILSVSGPKFGRMAEVLLGKSRRGCRDRTDQGWHQDD